MSTINDVISYDPHTCCMKEIREKEKKSYVIKNKPILGCNRGQEVLDFDNGEDYMLYTYNKVLNDVNQEEDDLRKILNENGFNLNTETYIIDGNELGFVDGLTDLELIRMYLSF